MALQYHSKLDADLYLYMLDKPQSKLDKISIREQAFKEDMELVMIVEFDKPDSSRDDLLLQILNDFDDGGSLAKAFKMKNYQTLRHSVGVSTDAGNRAYIYVWGLNQYMDNFSRELVHGTKTIHHDSVNPYCGIYGKATFIHDKLDIMDADERLSLEGYIRVDIGRDSHSGQRMYSHNIYLFDPASHRVYVADLAGLDESNISGNLNEIPGLKVKEILDYFTKVQIIKTFLKDASAITPARDSSLAYSAEKSMKDTTLMKIVC